MSNIDLITSIILSINIYAVVLAATLALVTGRYAWLLIDTAPIIVTFIWGNQLY